MRILFIPVLCALAMGAATADAGERRRHFDHGHFHGQQYGQHLIVPPGSRVIVIPPREGRHGYWSDRRPDRHDWRGMRRDFGHGGPGFGLHDRGRRFTTPGFSSGWVTTRPEPGRRRGW